MKYIDSEKLIAEIKRLDEKYRTIRVSGKLQEAREADLVIKVLHNISITITSLQQEQSKDKQIVIITESHGDANIKWDCRSLDDVIVLLKSAENFIADKQVEELRGPGSGPDYNTTEGRFRNAYKFQREQPEVDKYDCPTTPIEEAIEVTSRIQHIDEEMKPIAKFIMDYASWNLHKSEWNQPTIEVPLFRVLDALVQKGKPYCGS